MIKKFFFFALLFFALFPNLVSAEPIAYSIDSNANVYTIDLATGVATLIGPTGVSGDYEGLCFDSNGILYAVEDDADRLYTIDINTGAATLVGNLNVNIEGAGLSFDDSGTLWMATWSQETLYTINPSTGAATQVGSAGGLGELLDGTAWDGVSLYGIGSDYEIGTTDYLYVIDRTLGTAAQVGALTNIAIQDNTGLSEDATGTLWGIDEISGQIFTINKVTGEASIVSTTTPEEFESLAIYHAQAAIPTLSQWGMIIFSLLLVGSALWCRRKGLIA